MSAAAQAASTLVQFLFFVSVGLSIFGQMGDGATTSAALTLSNGLIEGNPIAAWLFKKIGYAATYALKGVGPIILSVAAFELSPKSGIAVASIFAVAGFAATIHNFIVLKKAGFSFKQVIGILG